MFYVIILLIIVMLINNILLKYHIDIKGSKEGNDNSNCIYDIGHNYLPKLKVDQISRNIGNFMASFPLIYTMIYLPNYTTRKLFIKDLIIIYLIRIVLNNLTILPSTKKCDNLDSTLFSVGGCCDYLFSGHTSTALLSSIYILFYINPNMAPILLVYNILNSLMIIMNRYHYTDDVLIAWIMCIFIFSLHYNKSSLDILKKIFILK